MSVAPPVERAPTIKQRVLAWQGGELRERDDVLAVEEPLEIRLAGWSVAVTMRTPGADLDLAAGFLFTEGIIRGLDDIATLEHCVADDADTAGNIVNVNPTDPSIVDPARWQRNFYTTSSCGICGKASIAGVRQRTGPIVSNVRISPAVLGHLDRELGREQALFRQTGGLHAAALFDLDGRLIVAREDVGRHNAVDKVIGAMLRADRVPLSEHILFVSSRASFEIVQKAVMAGIPIVAAVSAASSLAVDLARSANMTLAGFLRSEPDTGNGRFNVYAGEERIESGRSSPHPPAPSPAAAGEREYRWE